MNLNITNCCTMGTNSINRFVTKTDRVKGNRNNTHCIVTVANIHKEILMRSTSKYLIGEQI